MALPNLIRYEKFVDLTNGRMRYYELGSGTNHTILMHGMGVVRRQGQCLPAPPIASVTSVDTARPPEPRLGGPRC